MTTQTSSTQPPLSAAAASPSRKSSTSTPSDSGTATPAKGSESPWPIMPVTPRNTLGKKGRNRLAVGQVFGRLQIVGLASVDSTKRKVFKCACVCGKEVNILGVSISYGTSRSCGCLRIGSHNTHGMSETRVHCIWQNMNSRCGNKNSPWYKYYGGRGITICQEWKDFETFFADMGHPPTGFTLERVDNDAGYSKSNCRWASRAEQGHNRSGLVMSWDSVNAVRGSSKPRRLLAEELGVSLSTIAGVLANRTWYDPSYIPKRQQNANATCD